MSEEERLLVLEKYVNNICNNLKTGKTHLELLEPLSERDEGIVRSLLDKNRDVSYYVTNDIVPQIFVKLKKQIRTGTYNERYIRFEELYDKGDYENALKEIGFLILSLKRNNYHMVMFHKFENVYRGLGNLEEAEKYQILCTNLFKDFMKHKNLEDLFNLIYQELLALECENTCLGIIPYNGEINIKYLYRIASLLHIRFYIHGSDNNQVILIERYNLPFKEHDYRALKDKITYLFKKEKYEELIETIPEILKCSKLNRGKYYLYLGIAYKSLGKVDIAIRMLEASKIFNYLSGNPQNISKLNEMIREYSIFNQEDTENTYEMELDLLVNDKLLEIFKLVCLDLSLIDSFDLDNEEKIIIYLLLARDCFKNNNTNLGNKYIKLAERVVPKTKRASYLIKEIQQNKKLYENNKVKSLELKG